MAEIMASLFGVSPEILQQNRNLQDELLSLKLAQGATNPAKAMFGLSLGQSLGRGLMTGLGVADPELERATKLQSILQQTQQELGPKGLTNPELLYPTLSAKLNEAGLANEAVMTALQGQKAIQDYQLSGAKLATEQAQQVKALRDSQPEIVRLVAAKKAAIEAGDTLSAEAIQAEIDKKTYIPEKVRSPDVLAEETIRQDFVVKYGPVVGAQKFAEWQDARKQKVSAVQGTGKLLNVQGNEIGTYDEKGNFISSSGRVVSKQNIDEFGQANEASTNLLSIFNNIEDTDIDSAFGVAIDVTQNPVAALAANPKITQAQYKINQAGVRDVLNNLQSLKGASTDMEMNKMMSTFPRFQSSPETAKQWFARAKATTLDFLNRQKNTYGFDAPPVDIVQIVQDPMFKYLEEKEQANLIERLARWDVNFQALDEKDKVTFLNEAIKQNRPKVRKTVGGKTYEQVGPKQWIEVQ